MLELLEGASGLLVSGGLVLSGAPLLAARARRRWTSALGATTRLAARTGDGWRLAIHRYAPVHRRFREPVILCHGLAGNAFSFDLGEETSLARALARCGFDTYVAELRGSPGSWPARLPVRARWEYAFDHHALLDAPAVLDAVLASTGTRQAFWIGHSMGGMVGYVLASRRSPSLAGLVTIGSPARPSASPRLLRALSLALAVPVDPYPHRLIAQALAALLGERTPLPVIGVRANMAAEHVARLLVNGVADVPRRLTRQLAEWSDTDRVRSEDGRSDYLDAIARVTAPLLVVAASADRLAPPASVRPAIDLATAPDRTYALLGHDAPAGFGHVDVLMGRDAPRQAFPLVSTWLADRATPIRRAAPLPVRRAPLAVPDLPTAHAG